MQQPEFTLFIHMHFEQTNKEQNKTKWDKNRVLETWIITTAV
jgi:hypothetical protein